jgi:Integrase core domain
MEGVTGSIPVAPTTQSGCPALCGDLRHWPAIGGLDQARRDEGKRDRHVDVTNAASMASGDPLDRCGAGNDLVEPSTTTGDRFEQRRSTLEFDWSYAVPFGSCSRVRAMGARDRPVSPASPWRNGYAERPIGTVRRECLDRMVIIGAAHLRRVLASYTAYYNQARTHLALQKDAPLHRAVQRSGVIVAIPILARLHHQYVRI